MKTIPMWNDNHGKMRLALDLIRAGREELGAQLITQICDAADKWESQNHD